MESPLAEPSSNMDLAALRVLVLVHQLRSFTSAAAQLDVNQSAVSYTIEKLRRFFGDPLFFRQGGRVIPTERCDGLVVQAIDLLAQFDRMAAPAVFCPREAEGTVTVACNYYERLLWLPTILRNLQREAPGLRLRLVQATHLGPDLLKSGEADLLMGPIVPEASDYFCRTLVDDRYVCVMDAANPLAQAPLTAADYLAARHVTVSYGADWRSGYMRDLEAEGHALNTIIDVPSPAGIDQLLAGTDLISTIPARLAAQLTGQMVHLPCPFPAPFRISLVWTTRTHHAPMHAWLRKSLVDSVRTTLHATTQDQPARADRAAEAGAGAMSVAPDASVMKTAT